MYMPSPDSHVTQLELVKLYQDAFGPAADGLSAMRAVSSVFPGVRLVRHRERFGAVGLRRRFGTEPAAGSLVIPMPGPPHAVGDVVSALLSPAWPPPLTPCAQKRRIDTFLCIQEDFENEVRPARPRRAPR